MNKQLPFVSVIVPTFHDWDRLKICMNALTKQTYPKNRFEVIVVNNDPADPCPCGPLPDNSVLTTEGKPGSYAARNTGIKISKGEILAFTDSDCIPYSDWIEQAVNSLLGGAERVAGRVELFYRSGKLTLTEIYEKVFAFDQKKNAQTGGSVTANMITWKENFEKVGLFNDALISGGDFEWGWRAQDQGINIVYAPSVVVRHPARISLRELLEKEKRVIGGAVDIERIHPGRGHLIGLLRELRPPLKSYFMLMSHSDLPLFEKITAGTIVTCIKLNRIYLRARLLII